MKERYKRNLNALSEDEVNAIFTKKACVIGCGGLGCYVVETLARIGVLHITVVDNDVFDKSNLNRQLYSANSVIGVSKVAVAKKRVADVNPDVSLNIVKERFDKNNATTVINGHDIVIDALDNIPDRLMLCETCNTLGIPLVHGSIAGWYGRVSTIFPGDNTLKSLYGNSGTKGIETTLGNLPFTASVIASLQCSEAVKVLTGKTSVLRNCFLHVDLLNNEYEIFDIKSGTP